MLKSFKWLRSSQGDLENIERLRKRISTDEHQYLSQDKQTYTGIVRAIKALQRSHEAKARDDSSQSDRQLVWTRLTFLVVLLYTAVTFWLALIGHDANVMNSESGRAWIAPSQIVFNNPPKDGTPLSLTIFFSNVGKEPAINTRSRATVELVPMSEIEDLSTWLNPISDVCPGAAEVKTSGVTFPTTGLVNNKSSIFDIRRDQIDYWRKGVRYIPVVDSTPISDTASKRYVMMVSGCFVYTSINRERHTRWCAYLTPDADKPINQWLFRDCVNGNDAT